MNLPSGVGAPWRGTVDAVGAHHVPGVSDRKGEQQRQLTNSGYLPELRSKRSNVPSSIWRTLFTREMNREGEEETAWWQVVGLVVLVDLALSTAAGWIAS